MAQTPDDAPTPDDADRPDDGGPVDIGAGVITERAIDRELHESYLTYAMSTIMDRALPDVRDGLKPSQRRILVAMNDLSLSPGRKHRKCAKIAGDTSGNYHPHGESVIYPTLVNMGQDWKIRTKLVDKQGNFGSIDGDPPAAMRYTEARMTQAAVEMLADLKLDTVDYRSNYDDTRTEPVVLPSRFPNLLINGSSGIAVGMASSLPPHNPGEMLDAIVAVLDEPEIELQRLMEIVPGPDFPTGGVIKGRAGIAQAYSTGRGRITLRGKVHHEELKGRDVIVVDEIPYQVVQKALIEKTVEAARSGRIPDISDIKNFSGKTHRTRIMVYLKRGADPDVVEKRLYRFTPLQTTYSIISIALDRGRPRTMGLKQLIEAWIQHRREVVRRRTEHLLREARKQAHRLEGLIYAVCDIDEVIRIIRASRTREEAIESLMARAFRIPSDHPYAPRIPDLLVERTQQGDGIALTRVQAEAIGALRLIQLVGLEIEKLVADYAGLLEQIIDYEDILARVERVTSIIREDCVELREKFATERLTAIEEGESEDYDIGDLIAEHDVVVTVSHQGYVKRLPLDTYRQQGRGGVGIKGTDAKEGDFIERIFTSSSHTDLLCFTNTGRVFKLKVYQIPELSRTSRGRAIVNLLDLREGERVVALRTIDDFEKSEDYLFFATASGRVKRTSLKDYRNVNRSGIIAVNLNDGDRLIDVAVTSGEDHVLLATHRGMSIRFDENDARVMGRSAAGVKGIDLKGDDLVVGMVKVAPGDDSAEPDLLTITEKGYGKRTPLSDYLVQSESGARPQGRGGKGRLDIRTNERNGGVARVLAVHGTEDLMVVSEGGLIVRIAAESVRRTGRGAQGVRVMQLREGDRVVSAATVVDGGDEDDEIAAPTPESNGTA